MLYPAGGVGKHFHNMLPSFFFSPDKAKLRKRGLKKQNLWNVVYVAPKGTSKLKEINK